MMKSFEVNFSVTVANGVVLIIDNFDAKEPTRTVTNAADDLIPWLAAARIVTPERRVIYRDTQGMWDEIVHKDGQFERFAPIRTTSLDVAMLTVCPAGRA